MHGSPARQYGFDFAALSRGRKSGVPRRFNCDVGMDTRFTGKIVVGFSQIFGSWRMNITDKIVATASIFRKYSEVGE